MPSADGHRGSLVHSFAFRLGVAFAVVAIAATALTAGLVSAAFGTPFNRYLQQQRSQQIRQIADVVVRAYRGDGNWNVDALPAVGSLLGAGTLRLEDPYGNLIWRWPVPVTQNQSRGNHHQDASHHAGDTHSPAPGHSASEHSGWTADPSPSPSQGGWDNGNDWGNGGSWGDGGSGWGTGTRSITTTRDDGFVVVSVELASGPSLAPAQRVPITVDGRTVGYAVIRLPKASQQPNAVAFRSDLVERLLLGGIIAALISIGLGLVFALRATAPVRRVQGTARAISAGDRPALTGIDSSDEFAEVGRALQSMADSVDREERLRQGFAAQVAHELRTPLTILRSQVQGLRVGVLEPTPETIVSLDEEVVRISRLVADLQILGSADAAGFSLERLTIDLHELVDETVREFAGLFEGSEVRLETRLEPVTAWVDRVRVGQIVSNLLSNALKFTPPGGQVRVELRRDEPWAVLAVSDSGPGIPADELPRVFDRFFRGRGSRPGGSGIGLTVVHELARAHGGDVGVSSDPGSGATFTVRFPLRSTPTRNGNQTGSEHPLSTVPS
jgi:signal transduction histidine kinase